MGSCSQFAISYSINGHVILSQDLICFNGWNTKYNILNFMPWPISFESLNFAVRMHSIVLQMKLEMKQSTIIMCIIEYQKEVCFDSWSVKCFLDISLNFVASYKHFFSFLNHVQKFLCHLRMFHSHLLVQMCVEISLLLNFLMC